MKTKNINYVIKGIIAIVLMIFLCYLYRIMLDIKDENERLKQIYSNIEENVTAKINEYYIYGTHLNFNGYILKEDFDDFVVEKARVIIKDKNGVRDEISAILNEEEEKYNISISSNINEGINLEELIDEDYYVLFLKLSGKDKKANYIEKIYSFNNLSNISTNEYYTLTQNGKNNKIDILFNEDNKSIQIKSREIKLPENVYDFVIDAGHGGTDTGAQYLEYNEKDFTLDYSITLKEKLESLGYKVKLTRETDIRTPSYGENSRSEIPFETKAKLVLSIHFNSSDYDENNGGVEIYSPNHANLNFAKKIADNIVDYVGTLYSINSYKRVVDGVYVRTFNKEEIDSFREEAKNDGYELYESITTDTNYLFMIRETGGKITGAYMDGRNQYGSLNHYYDSNISAESYLLELGFINSTKEIERFKSKKNEYLDAICKSICENYNN